MSATTRPVGRPRQCLDRRAHEVSLAKYPGCHNEVTARLRTRDMIAGARAEMGAEEWERIARIAARASHG